MLGQLDGVLLKPAGIYLLQRPSQLLVQSYAAGGNGLFIKRHAEILEGLADGDMFYFVHSYHCVPKDKSIIVATAEHGVEVAAAISKDNLSATQFHPEKSGKKGLKLLDNFVRSTRC